jgi:hypothetical protein
MTCFKKYKHLESPNELIQIPHIKLLSKNISIKGNEILVEKLKQFATHSASLVVDGYSKRKRKIKAYILVFPQFKKKEVVKIINIDNSQLKFSESAAEVIEFCKKLNICTTTLNYDGYSLFYFILFFCIFNYLASQCNAFTLNKKDNFESFLQTPQDIRNFHNRCCNHLVQLSINNFVKKVDWINNFENKMLNDITFINSNNLFKKLMGVR